MRAYCLIVTFVLSPPSRAARSRRRAGSLLLVAALGLSGCGVFGSDGPDEVASAFVAAFAEGDTARAAELTDSPDAARRGLDAVRSALEPQGMDAEVVAVRERGETAEVAYELSWRWARDRRWEYEGRATLRSVGGEWSVNWQPSVVHPRLGQGETVALRTDPPALAPVLDRDGAELLRPDKVVSVLLHPDEAGEQLDDVVAALGQALEPLDAGISERSITRGLEETEDGEPYVVAALRSADYGAVEEEIYELPGVRFTSRQRLLSPDRDLGSQLVPAIRAAVAEQVEGKAGWRVVTLGPQGAEVDQLHRTPPEPAEAVRSTVSLRAQQSAEAALADVDGAGAIVALRPDSGDILAVAQNEDADDEGAIALTGRYPPGSTFKIVTAAAALDEGLVSVDEKVDCPATTVIENRLIPNDGEFELGTVPFRTAFAQSCNTTFAHLATDLPAESVTEAALRLGIGADFVVPGITTVTGSAEPGDGVVARAEAGFGQGTMLASPFGMALVAATVAHGSTPVPTLLDGARTEATVRGEAPPAGVVDSLRELMRAVVTDGSAAALRDLGDVHGKTGTAQYGDGSRAHGWFVGYRDDVAFAVLLVGADSSGPAVSVAGEFLRGL